MVISYITRSCRFNLNICTYVNTLQLVGTIIRNNDAMSVLKMCACVYTHARPFDRHHHRIKWVRCVCACACIARNTTHMSAALSLAAHVCVCERGPRVHRLMRINDDLRNWDLKCGGNEEIGIAQSGDEGGDNDDGDDSKSVYFIELTTFTHRHLMHQSYTEHNQPPVQCPIYL